VTRFASSYPAAAHTFADELDDNLTVDGASGHHLGRVRRLRAGEVVTVADGRGQWRPYAVVEARHGAVDLDARGAPVTEPPLVPGLTVAFALTKAAKPDLAVQKLSELGVDRVTPLLSQRTVRRWDVGRAGAAVDRLRRVAAEAAVQCRRARLLDVDAPRPLSALHGHLGLVVADSSGDNVAELAAPSNAQWVLAVGPEGGFEDDELAVLEPCARLRLGPHVLRAETAAIAGAAVLTTRRVPNLGGSW
jgi:16S rRNA (uracil1498-N3)-methyltransferase